MAGMGEEEVYKVTLDIKGKDGAEGPDTNQAEEEDGQREEEPDDEEDAFAMMAGMGEEEVYKVTLDIKGKEGAEGPEAVEEAVESRAEDPKPVMLDFDELDPGACESTIEEDPFAMMAGMGEEEVYKVTLDIKGRESAEGEADEDTNDTEDEKEEDKEASEEEKEAADDEED